MQILSFDSTTPAVHTCLMRGHQVVYENVDEPSGPHRQESAAMLIPAIDKALVSADWLKEEIDAIVVGVGPGSFTGTRVAVVTARTLGQALGQPCIGVCYLEVLARAATRPCAVVLSAGKGHFFAAAFDEDENLLNPIVLPGYFSGSDMSREFSGVKRWYADTDAVATLVSDQMEVLPLPTIKNIALTQAEIIVNRLSLTMPAKELLLAEFPWHKLEPLYLRGPSVTVKRSNGSSDSTNDPYRP